MLSDNRIMVAISRIVGKEEKSRGRLNPQRHHQDQHRKGDRKSQPDIDQKGRDRQKQDGQDDDNAKGKAHVLSLKGLSSGSPALAGRPWSEDAPDQQRQTSCPAQMVGTKLGCEACAKVAGLMDPDSTAPRIQSAAHRTLSQFEGMQGCYRSTGSN
jgi:hypothetical protein